MVNWDEVKGKLGEITENAKKAVSFSADKAKGIYSVAADKTQKSARMASLKVKIVMEENKINKALGELGKRTYDLIDKGETSISTNGGVKEMVAAVKASKKSIEQINEELKGSKS
jgi:hypothetical protein